MSYTCKDFGSGQPCNGCGHDMREEIEFEKFRPQPPAFTGMNRAQRRAAAKRMIGYAKHPCQLCGGLHSTVDCMTKGAR